PASPATGATVKLATPRNTEAERAAILQMIADGRLSPEEGDMLLEALA
ncbi:MAG: hypothetical protein H7Z42_17250, partial [Roseiflexaceae bacterium]|nr:hypothetical protein [Roseiflexaceae bacterium]